MDYIYQGPIIFVLLVGPLQGLGWCWNTRRTIETHLGRGTGKMWSGQTPIPTLGVAPMSYICCLSPQHPLLSLLYPVLLWTSGSFSGWRKG